MSSKKHLPLYGIGPILCCPMAVLTAIGIYCSSKALISGLIENKTVNIILYIIGTLLIIEGIILFFAADLNGNLQKNIKENKLKTNGSYKFVRNPCYCLFLLSCTGAILIAHNWYLFVLPFVFWGVMTIVLINTEEKWLRNLYGKEYEDYCKRVNRCIPWFPKKENQ
ncbi:MAG: isoprenylcysteine carboxylmethyltransferase family protein [Oscillospiraceae bacterium]|nr:isoprenylcysteine carboxylmethyltransferase family protein [Oscillospiraceae bacterium]